MIINIIQGQSLKGSYTLLNMLGIYGYRAFLVSQGSELTKINRGTN